MAKSSCAVNSKTGRRLIDGQAAKEVKLCHGGRLCVVGFQLRHRAIQGQYIVWSGIKNAGQILETHALHRSSSLDGLFPTRVLDQNPPHGLRGSRKEMTAAIPTLGRIAVY